MCSKLLRCPAIVALLLCAHAFAICRCHWLNAAEGVAPARSTSPGEKREVTATAPKQKVTWDASELRQIEKEWLGMSVSSDATPATKSCVRAMNLKGLLKNKLTTSDISELTASLGTVPVEYEKQTEFQAFLIDSLASILVDSGAREDLIVLFSMHFCGHIGYASTEWVLVTEGKNLKDPILVLGEAYARSRSRATRADRYGRPLQF